MGCVLKPSGFHNPYFSIHTVTIVIMLYDYLSEISCHQTSNMVEAIRIVERASELHAGCAKLIAIAIKLTTILKLFCRDILSV